MWSKCPHCHCHDHWAQALFQKNVPKTGRNFKYRLRKWNKKGLSFEERALGAALGAPCGRSASSLVMLGTPARDSAQAVTSMPERSRPHAHADGFVLLP